MSAKKSYTYFLSAQVESQEAICWTLAVFAQYAQVDLVRTEQAQNADFTLGYDASDSIFLDRKFWNRIQQNDFSCDEFDRALNLKSNDLIGTAFYFLNCLWERDPKRKTDHWGRSEFGFSIWSDFGYERPFNHVNAVFDRLASKLKILISSQKSEVFLSHDIDAVYSGWKENGMNQVKKLKIGAFAKELINHLTGKPIWFNFNRIIEIEKEKGVTSTFFWITSQSKIRGVGKNADYRIHSPKIKKSMDMIESSGSFNAIHKSIDTTNLKEEMTHFGRDVKANRYHYLKFSFEALIDEMENSGLHMDASLGYAQTYGFRNGYSLPFVPFNLKENRPSTFVEVPLTLMDATFSRYFKLNQKEAEEAIIDYLNANQSNAVISVLWHNTHFTDGKYEGYEAVYKGILNWLVEHKHTVTNPELLIKKYI